jgi:hypothetical protein
MRVVVKKLVIEGAPSSVLTVSITSDNSDTACLLQPADHPYLSKPSCIVYDRITVVEPAVQAKMVADAFKTPALVEFYQPMNAAVLKRIVDGAGKSKFISQKNRSLILGQ